MRISSVVLASILVAASASVAAAHCCHDELMLGTAQQSQFRRGLHGVDDGITDDAIQAEPPTVGDSLNTRGPANSGIGGLGEMHGNSFGNYGAGSLGQTGPGGLGSLRNGGLGTGPAHPR